ncbi:hypothetical protein PR003_g15378 [Phytophthora rubi]|uniref:Bzip transcription factor n=1 Tax=Phytophthora rubi TaxID=129364 RepID=A0A6A3K7W9_9STRA|nr:hypothetical protein PR002_g18315 [Phytophthora rubi]KAE9013946.1 hypothetical protein PR001_g15260 [Phytophthora rubi]KAE9330190.1 hypothetical protein PR003_g15378 [Phytophthora rubi]
MASQFEFPHNASLDRFERTRAKLSDGVIGHVLPRGRAPNHHFGSDESPTNPLKAHRGLSPQSDTLVTEGVESWIPPHEPSTAASPVSVATNAALSELGTEYRTSCRGLHRIEDKATRIEMKKAIRREQCRTNQARYRNRQRIRQGQLQHEVQQLQEELQGLRLKRQRLRLTEKTNSSPWAVVSEIFRLLETSFRSPWHMTSGEEMMKHAETRQSLRVLQQSFRHDVTMGSVSGTNALLEQLRRYALYFSDPQIQLKRVESVAPGVLTASALLSVTVSEFTLRCVFPHLEKANSSDADAAVDEYRALREKLLGQRLSCSCEMTLLLDGESDRVVRLETSINLVESLFRVLGSAGDVVDVLQQALMTPECVVGDVNAA